MAKFTEKAITDVFVQLLDQMPLDRITVRNITKECCISRNTFYYHYSSVCALLEALLKQEIQQLQSKRRAEDTWYDDLLKIFVYISNNRKRAYHVFLSLDHSVLTQYLFQATEGLFLEYVRTASEGMDAAEDDLRFICFSYQSMFVEMLLEWLRLGMKDEPMDFFERAQRLMQGNTRRMLEASAGGKSLQRLHDQAGAADN